MHNEPPGRSEPNSPPTADSPVSEAPAQVVKKTSFNQLQRNNSGRRVAAAKLQRRSYDSYELVIVPLCEAGLLLLAGAAAMLVHKPLFFASLGPTAYEIAETPERKSAQPYSVIGGHLIGVVSGFLAIAVTQAWRAPATNTYCITWVRVWAAMLAALLTVVGTTLFRATQPAALSTTLMIATGSMQRLQDGPVIMAAILLLTIAGEPLRRWRHKCRLSHSRLQIEHADCVYTPAELPQNVRSVI